MILKIILEVGGGFVIVLAFLRVLAYFAKRNPTGKVGGSEDE